MRPRRGNNNQTNKKRKVRIDMSVELDVLMSKGQDEKAQLDNIARIYSSCFGGKDIKIENIQFLD